MSYENCLKINKYNIDAEKLLSSQIGSTAKENITHSLTVSSFRNDIRTLSPTSIGKSITGNFFLTSSQNFNNKENSSKIYKKQEECSLFFPVMRHKANLIKSFNSNKNENSTNTKVHITPEIKKIIIKHKTDKGLRMISSKEKECFKTEEDFDNKKYGIKVSKSSFLGRNYSSSKFLTDQNCLRTISAIPYMTIKTNNDNSKFKNSRVSLRSLTNIKKNYSGYTAFETYKKSNEKPVKNKIPFKLSEKWNYLIPREIKQQTVKKKTIKKTNFYRKFVKSGNFTLITKLIDNIVRVEG
jgi:hypothetical protein